MSPSRKRDPNTGTSRLDLDALPPTVSVVEAGEILGIGRSSAYQAARTGELPTIPLGRRLVVPTARLLELLGHRRAA